ncbi:hypothetical protein U1Q18_017774 [Sarracenia purpurea var. burkii]
MIHAHFFLYPYGKGKLVPWLLLVISFCCKTLRLQDLEMLLRQEPYNARLCNVYFILVNHSFRRLYVWDDSKYIPLLVNNNAAELLFGNIKAEKVHSCYGRQKYDQTPYSETPNANNAQNTNPSDARATTRINDEERGIRSGKKEKNLPEIPNFYLIWLVLLKLLVRQGKNSPLKFKVRVNVGRDWESGRFEMVSMSMPCFGTMASSV